MSEEEEGVRLIDKRDFREILLKALQEPEFIRTNESRHSDVKTKS